ncbi:MAG: hypothetical protein IT452_09550 [Planctomycetia bacterium]|nr:hypothetical protein [Planctomycetia bacterium]
MPVRQILITAADARAKGFPPVALSVDLEDTVLSGFPGTPQGALLRLSGPPGGPLGVSVEIVPAGSALEALVRERFDVPNFGPLRIGATVTVDVAGARRPGLAFATGQSLAAMGQVATLVEFPGKDFAALVILGCGGREPDAAATLAQRDLAAVAKTLRVSA